MTTTTIYLEENAEDLYLAWTDYPGVFGLNLSVFRDQQVNAVEDLLEAMNRLGFNPGTVVVAEGWAEYDLHEFYQAQD